MQLDQFEKEDQHSVEEDRKHAWEAYMDPILSERSQVAGMIAQMAVGSSNKTALDQIKDKLVSIPVPFHRDVVSAAMEVLIESRNDQLSVRQPLVEWVNSQQTLNQDRYGSHLYSQSKESALLVPEVKPIYSESLTHPEWF